MPNTDPSVEELAGYIQELILEDPKQDVTFEFDVFFSFDEDEVEVVMPAALVLGMQEHVWFQFYTQGDSPKMTCYFSGPVWKAYYLIRRVQTGQVRDSLSKRSPEEEARIRMAEARERVMEQLEDDKFYETIINLCDREREIGYEAGLADAKGRWKNWPPFKWFS